MKKIIQRVIIGFLFFTGLSLTPGCDMNNFLSDGTGSGFGILAGTINIGPLCPVETIPPDPACLPTAATFKAYPVGIWTADGKTKVITISPGINGSYSQQLPTGFYLIDRETTQAGVGGSNLPKTVGIDAGYTTILNISIDTGIR
jgi:hypothetical protein